MSDQKKETPRDRARREFYEKMIRAQQATRGDNDMSSREWRIANRKNNDVNPLMPDQTPTVNDGD